MGRLALPERVLMQIEKPARYIGNEVNMVQKNPEDVDVRIAMCFPDVYEMEMSPFIRKIFYNIFYQVREFSSLNCATVDTCEFRPPSTVTTCPVK